MSKRYLLFFAALILSTSTFYGCEEDITPKPPKNDTDTTSPRVTFNSPATDAVDVAVDSTISVTFSEEINAFTVTTDTFSVTGDDAVDGEIVLAGGNLVATFTPSANLTNGTLYTVYLTSGIKDDGDNSLTPFIWNFTTVDSDDGDATSATPKVFGTAIYGRNKF